jgi:hypothetical protein
MQINKIGFKKTEKCGKQEGKENKSKEKQNKTDLKKWNRECKKL